jgi:hypothetical protein
MFAMTLPLQALRRRCLRSRAGGAIGFRVLLMRQFTGVNF